MKVFKNIKEIAKELKIKEWKVQKALDTNRDSKIWINDIMLLIEFCNNKLEYVLLDENNNADCKQYIIRYMLDKFQFACKNKDKIKFYDILDFENEGMEIIKVKINIDNRQVWKECRYCLDLEDIKVDNNIYYSDCFL
ncbi:hypothetical protein FC831_15285 [Clostridium botulinum]|nr:hypothetical protein [Clostridium botulinum]